MAASAQAVLDVARSQIGYREGPNNDTKYGAWYGLNNQPWCAMFVSWCAAQVSALDIIPKHAWTPAGAQWFQQQGRWGGAPQSGAIVYFDFPGGFNGVEHVGIVETVEGDRSATTAAVTVTVSTECGDVRRSSVMAIPHTQPGHLPRRLQLPGTGRVAASIDRRCGAARRTPTRCGTSKRHSSRGDSASLQVLLATTSIRRWLHVRRLNAHKALRVQMPTASRVRRL